MREIFLLTDKRLATQFLDNWSIRLRDLQRQTEQISQTVRLHIAPRVTESIRNLQFVFVFYTSVERLATGFASAFCSDKAKFFSLFYRCVQASCGAHTTRYPRVPGVISSR
jgi:hypothetical protein